MKFQKFGKWVLAREQTAIQNQAAGAAAGSDADQAEINKVTASMVGQPKNKVVAALKALAQKKAMQKGVKPETIGKIADAANGGS